MAVRSLRENRARSPARARPHRRRPLGPKACGGSRSTPDAALLADERPVAETTMDTPRELPAEIGR
jgi:hypothetical protein